jgi:hypothetical protein
MKAVWHYFNEAEDFCWLKNTRKQGERLPLTVCGIVLKSGPLHTEYREQVTCKRCLHGIVAIENPKDLSV